MRQRRDGGNQRRNNKQCRERPRGRAAEQRDELATLHSITSSAVASSLSGTVSPSALAVFRLITSSYLVGACTGRSAGFSPLRIDVAGRAPMLIQPIRRVGDQAAVNGGGEICVNGGQLVLGGELYDQRR